MTTDKRDQLKNQLASKANNLPDKPRSPEQRVGDYLKAMMPAISQVLPSHLNAERLQRIALNVIRTNPKLLEATTASLMGGVLEAAKLGLEPGMLGQCYLIPFENRRAGTVESQFIIGYRGLIDLVRRSGQVSTIDAREVHENDHFEFEYGIDSKLVHKPVLTNRGAVIAFYAVAKMKDGGYSFLVMSKEEIEKHRDKFARSKNYGPWVDHFEEMSKKTVLRALIKYLPISVEYLANDEANGAQVHAEVDASGIIDVGAYEVINGNTVDVNSGEIVTEGKPDAE